jgi:hypothetical protein
MSRPRRERVEAALADWHWRVRHLPVTTDAAARGLRRDRDRPPRQAPGEARAAEVSVGPIWDEIGTAIWDLFAGKLRAWRSCRPAALG